MFSVSQDAKLGKYVCVEGRETYLVRLNDDGVDSTYRPVKISETSSNDCRRAKTR
jgi:hypothetical protein